MNEKEKVVMIPISSIDDFPDHPFEVRDDEEMELLANSISSNGVLNPVILRANGERFEIIAGHRRKYACAKIGVAEVPAIVREMTREEAIVEMVDSNLHREHILPSEKAKAYKMKMDAMKKRAGRPSKENLTPVVSNLRTDEIIGEESGESREQVRRYIRLNELVPELLKMVDEGRIALRPAVELSYLTEDEQMDLLETIESEDCTPSHAQTIRMRKLSNDDKLSMDAIFAIMTEEKGNQKEKVKIPMENLERFFPRGTPPKRVEETIIKALTFYQKHLNKKREDRDDR
jgi:ParB family chromosome partitioning protein